jgi:hypothetical protein
MRHGFGSCLKVPEEISILQVQRNKNTSYARDANDNDAAAFWRAAGDGIG